MARGHQPQSCSFCGKGSDQTQRLIAGPNGVFICAECVALCNQILAEGPQPPTTPTNATTRAAPHPQRSAWRRFLFH